MQAPDSEYHAQVQAPEGEYHAQVQLCAASYGQYAAYVPRKARPQRVTGTFLEVLKQGRTATPLQKCVCLNGG